MSFNNPEIGRELSVSELNVKQLVVIKPPGRDDILMTAWVGGIEKEWIRFDCNQVKWKIINRITPDGKMVDDQNRHVQIYEYLGEP